MNQILSRLVLCVTAVVPFLKEFQNLDWGKWKEIIMRRYMICLLKNPLCSLLNLAKVKKEVG